MELSLDQQQAEQNIINWFNDPDRRRKPFVLVGGAGTGKTTMSKHVIDKLGIKASQQVVLATTASATANIMNKSQEGVTAKTIASTLKAAQVFISLHDAKDRVVGDYSQYGSGDSEAFDDMLKKLAELGHTPKSPVTEIDKLNLALANRAIKPGHYLKKRVEFANLAEANLDRDTFKIVIVDELGMVGDEELKLVRETKIPVLAMGDPNQLDPIGSERSKLIDDETRENYSKLTTTHRQAGGNPILDVADACRTGKNWLDVAHQVHNGSQLIYAKGQKLVPQALASADKILAVTNKSTIKYNKEVHEHLFGDVPLAVGEKIVITANSNIQSGALPTFVNGTDAIVKAIRPAPKDPNDELMNMGLIIVDLDINGYLYEEVFLNIVDFSNPKISAYELENSRDEDIDAGLMYRRKNKQRIEGYMIRNSTTEYPEVIYATYGYATTVHKAQGKEYDCVILDSYIPYPMRDMAPKISYTAVTRAKRALLII